MESFPLMWKYMLDAWSWFAAPLCFAAHHKVKGVNCRFLSSSGNILSLLQQRCKHSTQEPQRIFIYIFTSKLLIWKIWRTSLLIKMGTCGKIKEMIKMYFSWCKNHTSFLCRAKFFMFLVINLLPRIIIRIVCSFFQLYSLCLNFVFPPAILSVTFHKW